jgi:myo-inositol-1(or 4)-monophosphatase
MIPKNLEELTCKSCKLVKTVGSFIKKQIGKVGVEYIEEKELNSLVSYVDQEAEKKLVRGLKKLIPESVFLTEESTIEQAKGDYRWIIDPLDGTTNFLWSIPIFSVTIALEYKGVVVLGIVYEINKDELFYAWKDGGAYLNGKPIHVSNKKTLSSSLIATGFPYHNYSQITGFMKALDTFMHKSRGIRRLGSAAVDLAYVACGRFDLYFESILNPWDISGGALIVVEAGGVVTDYEGKNTFWNGHQILAATDGIHTEGLNVLKESFLSVQN